MKLTSGGPACQLRNSDVEGSLIYFGDTENTLECDRGYLAPCEVWFTFFHECLQTFLEVFTLKQTA